MEDFLSWFYEHYIKTPLSSQPPDFGTACRADLLRSVLDPFLQQQLEELNRFYALRSFPVWDYGQDWRWPGPGGWTTYAPAAF